MPEPYETNVELTDSVPAADPTPKADEAPVETPSPEGETKVTTPEADPADPTATADPAQPVETLYDLPDGRKVNAETLAKEFKENFLPDYTRKSQILSQIEGKKDPTNPEEKKKPWQEEGYEPKNWAEAIEISKREAIEEIRAAHEKEEARIASVHEAINTTLAEIKAIDPKLDENKLFEHANNYGFQDLKMAHKNMVAMQATKVQTEQKVVKNLQKREADPVSSAAGGGNVDDTGYDPGMVNNFSSASEFLAHLKTAGKK